MAQRFITLVPFIVLQLFIITGHDFSNEVFSVTIPSHSEEFSVPTFLSIVDDEVNEVLEALALVAVIEDDVPKNITCFQEYPFGCIGSNGVTMIWIQDNDR